MAMWGVNSHCCGGGGNYHCSGVCTPVVTLQTVLDNKGGIVY